MGSIVRHRQYIGITVWAAASGAIGLAVGLPIGAIAAIVVFAAPTTLMWLASRKVAGLVAKLHRAGQSRTSDSPEQ
jgi:hypothetical protein